MAQNQSQPVSDLGHAPGDFQFGQLWEENLAPGLGSKGHFGGFQPGRFQPFACKSLEEVKGRFRVTLRREVHDQQDSGVILKPLEQAVIVQIPVLVLHRLQLRGRGTFQVVGKGHGFQLGQIGVELAPNAFCRPIQAPMHVFGRIVETALF